MSVILLTKGPVCTFTAIQTNGPPAVRRIDKTLFIKAAEALAAVNLGTVVKVCLGRNRPNEVFIKTLPAELAQGFEGNEDLCDLEEYTAKFYMPAPSRIHQRLRDELIEKQYVKAEHFTNLHGK